ncbi:hypothetical protein [Bradyrhizobium lablabi]|uniref:hypothetical protein n=1 Tax=Bradyrhizobium lablabi TaxID=722472 RepID=UPI001BA63766|nr:hypothetical protein [Bradyrhizobium lablabi]MBR0693317.1 hypothetical protein [Bradyrhizobium lablabi]
MSEFLGPLGAGGNVPSRQQTRVAAFLVSAHGALARQLAFAQPGYLKAGWQAELNAQLYRESEIVSLLLRATSWVPDPALAYLFARWEMTWLPQSIDGIPERTLSRIVDLSTLAHALHAAIRPAALLPVEANAEDPFVSALRRIEFESGRMLQAQILFLKGQDLKPFRRSVSAALEERHAQVRRLWSEMLEEIGVSVREG